VTDTASNQTESRKYILFVDDEITLSEFLIEAIRDDYDIDVDAASTVEVALEKMQERHYDLLITDLHMKPMTGLDLISHIRNEHVVDERTRTIPIILRTGAPIKPSQQWAEANHVICIDTTYDLDSTLLLIEKLLGLST
jgi:CheY-like chemotaxis protein